MQTTNLRIYKYTMKELSGPLILRLVPTVYGSVPSPL